MDIFFFCHFNFCHNRRKWFLSYCCNFGAERAAPVTQNNPVFYGNLQHSPDFANKKFAQQFYTRMTFYILFMLKIRLKY